MRRDFEELKRCSVLRSIYGLICVVLIFFGNFVVPQSDAAAAKFVPLKVVQAELSSSVQLASLSTNVIPSFNQWGNLFQDDFGAIATGGGLSKCWNNVKSSSSLPDCVFGDPKATRTLVLTGDSQAYMWEPAFDQWGKTYSWKIDVLTKGSCQPWPDPHQEYYDNSPFPACGVFQTKVERFINKTQPSVVVAAGLMPMVPDPTTSLAIKDIANFVTSITPSRAKVLIVSPSPSFYTYDFETNSTVSAPTCLTLHPQQIKSCNGTPVNQLTSDPMEMAIVKNSLPAKSELLNLTQLLCTTKCPMIADGILIYASPNHITHDWAVHVSGALGQILSPLLNGR